jgi:hypothetical protein
MIAGMANTHESLISAQDTWQSRLHPALMIMLACAAVPADPISLLVDSAAMASWVRQGLPSDPTSMQNGMILTNSERWPLMMDPQLQGVVWIKERESKNNLQVCPRQHDTHVQPPADLATPSHSPLEYSRLLTSTVNLAPIYSRTCNQITCCHAACRLFAWEPTTW